MSSAQAVQDFSAQARLAASEGRWPDAEELWREVRRLDPNNPQALFSLGVHEMQKGEDSAAVSYLELACLAAPNDLFSKLTLAVAYRRLEDSAKELAAIDSALAVDPYFVPALLAKGAWFERRGSAANAAMHYRVALKFAPPEPGWPLELQTQLRHAQQVSSAHGEFVETQLLVSAQGILRTLSEMHAARWREAASIASGKTAPYVSQCNQFHVPRLPAVPFFDRDQFPWVAALEAETDAIRSELDALLREAPGDFAPYVAYPAGAPVNQWRELNHSKRWSGFHLWRNGRPIEENLRRCPRTSRALERVQLPHIDGLCPNVMFSALAPHTHIPPHTGETNARVVAHLPLIVPEHCRYRVGYEHRSWEVGKALIFDDTIEHEAHNDSDELRVVLLFDLWNPFLTTAERDAARVMLEALRALHA